MNATFQPELFSIFPAGIYKSEYTIGSSRKPYFAIGIESEIYY
jgi:hypothetical protein